jgi:hypothetical protein
MGRCLNPICEQTITAPLSSFTLVFILYRKIRFDYPLQDSRRAPKLEHWTGYYLDRRAGILIISNRAGLVFWFMAWAISV